MKKSTPERKYMLGVLIGDIRTQKGILQEKFGEGVCARERLCRYEAGDCEPEKLLADALMQRLGKSMDKYFAYLGHGEYEMT